MAMLTPVPETMARSPISIEEAQNMLARRGRSEEVWNGLTSDQRIHASFSARQYLALALLNDDLRAFVWSPSSGWWRIPRDYWRLSSLLPFEEIVERSAIGESFERHEGRFVDSEPGLEGQPILLLESDVERLAAAWGVGKKAIEQPEGAESDDGQPRVKFKDADLIEESDRLWCEEGIDVRQIEKVLRENPDFAGATVASIRVLLTGRYIRTGKGSLEARLKHIKSLKQ